MLLVSRRPPWCLRGSPSLCGEEREKRHSRAQPYKSFYERFGPATVWGNFLFNDRKLNAIHCVGQLLTLGILPRTCFECFCTSLISELTCVRRCTFRFVRCQAQNTLQNDGQSTKPEADHSISRCWVVIIPRCHIRKLTNRRQKSTKGLRNRRKCMAESSECL